jgi:hypothetical protein
MDFLRWLVAHGRDSLEAVGIIAGLGFTAASFREDTKSRRLTNLLVLTGGHREIWSRLIERRELAPVLDATVDVRAAPPALPEEVFINHLIQHLAATYRAIESGLLLRPEQLQRDIRRFFSLPIPLAVWQQQRLLLDEDFARLVEDCLG